MYSDPIADLLTRIRNASIVRHVSVSIPASNVKKAIIEKLVSEGYVDSFEVIEDGAKKSLLVRLKYDRYGDSVIEGIQRVSKPGRRVYVGAEDVPRVRSGLGTMLVSTSRGIMTDAEARSSNQGGELLCKVW